MTHCAASRGSCVDARAAANCERAAQVQGRRDALPSVSIDRKLEIALAGDLETNCRLKHAVTVSFLHEERVLLRNLAESADGPAARPRRADISFRWRAGRARAGPRRHPEHGLGGERAPGRTR